jgi:hypothetical protein
VLPDRPAVWGHTRPVCIPSTAPLSIAHLTELAVTSLSLKDAEAETLLPACPQLLRLDCAVSQSWNVVLIAARLCPCLLDLTARGAGSILGRPAMQPSQRLSQSLSTATSSLSSSPWPCFTTATSALRPASPTAPSSSTSSPALTLSCATSTCTAAASPRSPCCHCHACLGYLAWWRAAGG